MEAKDIGLCALFRGVDYVAKVSKRPREQVKAFTTLINNKTTPCLSKLLDSIRNVSSDIGTEETAGILRIPPDVLRLLLIGYIIPSTDLEINKMNIDNAELNAFDEEEDESSSDADIKLDRETSAAKPNNYSFEMIEED